MTFYSNTKRKDYVLNPRGKALYDDSNRFGTKMLEKMGWSKGKGLGANLNGQLDFIKVSHKSDQKGIGFQDRDDQWTSHENNFNSLLKSIKSVDNSDEELQDFTVQGFRNDDNVVNNDEVKKEKLLSGISLEEQSKKSKARVHYKKFTRGKDISRYSEKDLANIFGKKSLNSNAEAEIAADTENSSNDAPADKETPNFGITTIETGTTITEYFNKKKMKKTGEKSTSSENSEIEKMNGNAVDADTKIDKKKPKKLKPGSTGCEQRNATFKDSVIEVNENLPQSQERVNSTKRKHNSDSAEQTKLSKKKKKKKDKVLSETIEIVERESVNHFHNGLPNTSEKSKNYNKIVQTLAESPQKEVSSEQQPSSSEKSKKNKRGKQRESSNSMTDKAQEEDSSIVLNDNVYEIRSYRAEIFRYFDLHGFSGSSLSDIPGYGYTRDLSLKIVDKASDGKLINTLWNDTRNKYAHLEDGNKPKKKKFVEHIQDLKKKNIFKI